MELLMFLILTLKQMLDLSLHQVWYHGGNMHTLLGEGYWIVMASVDGLLRRFVLDLQSWYVVKQFLIATGKLLNPDPRRLSTGQLRSLGMAPFRAGDIIIGAPVRYCFYCSAGIARTVYTISTSPKYLLRYNRKYAYQHDSVKTAAHRKHHAHCAQSRRGHHFRVKGQVPYQTFSVPREMCQKDPDDDAAAAVLSSGNKSQVCYIEANNNKGLLKINKNVHNRNDSDKDVYIDSIFENSIIDNCSKVPEDLPDDMCDKSDHVCLFHAPYILGEDPKYYQILKQYNTRLSLYRKLPWKTISRLWGQFHQLELPVWLRGPAFRLYIWMFQCNLHEASVTDLKSYRNLSEFFRRTLRPGVRPIDSTHILTSPADGTMLHLSEVKNGALEQVKGIAYSIRGFLGPKGGLLFQQDLDIHVGYLECLSDDEYARSLLTNPRDNALYHCITYLAPGDYHRFHSPADWTVYARRHFPGELFSVKPGVARWLQGLFNYNERAVYTGRWRYGFFSMTAVGATNVGSINVYFDEELYTNCPDDRNHEVFYDANFTSKKKSGVRVKKGQLIGEFNLGSTIVLIFEAPKKFRFSVREGRKVRYGQGIGLCRKRRKRNK